MEIKIETTQTFEHCYNSTKKVQLHQGSARSGKSFGILQYLVVKAIESKTLISIVRKTFPALRTSALRDFKEIMKGLGIWDDDRYMATEHTYTFDNDSVIEFFSTDVAEKLKGLRRDILWIDEANELSYEQYFQLAIRTTDKIILSFNPSFSPKHWILSEVQTDNDSETFITTYKHNPFLPTEQVRFIEKYKDTNPRYWLTYGLGQFAVNEKQIYEFEIVEPATEEEYNTMEFIGWGLDLGFVQDPSALVSVWKRGESLYINEHLYQKALITSEIIQVLKQAVDVRDRLIVDCAEPRLIDEIRRAGFPLVKAVKKGKDSITYGIDLVKKYKLLVPKDATNLIEELYSYEWLSDINSNVTNTPMDANNHLLDALRYTIMELLNAKKTTAGTYTIGFPAR
jgi:phage terminase large subunit